MFGTVKWYSNDKAYGFIIPDGGGEDLFAPMDAIVMPGFKMLVEGMRVEFEVVQTPKGKQASSIRVEGSGW